MTVQARRDRERTALRERILEAARELFVSEGIERVSMRRIAQRIGYTPTTLYHHFHDKEALLRALCEADFLALRQSFERIARIPDPLERLRRLGQTYVQFGLSNPNHYRLLFMTPHSVATGSESERVHKGNPDEDAYAFLKATVEEAIRAGCFRPEYKDADLVSQLVWSGVHGVVALHLIMSGDPWLSWRPVKKVASGVIEVMLRGLAKAESGGPSDG